MRLKCNIDGLDCANCALKIEDNIKKLDSVNSANVNFLTGRINIDFQDNKDPKELFAEIKKECKKIEPDCEVERI